MIDSTSKTLAVTADVEVSYSIIISDEFFSSGIFFFAQKIPETSAPVSGSLGAVIPYKLTVCTISQADPGP